MPDEKQQEVRVADVLAALTRCAPLSLQESYDNAGLQVGTLAAVVTEVLLAVDVTEAVVDEAVARGSNVIVAHHPLLFHPLARVSDSTYIERCVARALRHNIAIIAMHTNIDAAQGGVNHKIAEKIGLHALRSIGEEKEVDGIRGSAGVMGMLPASLSAEAFIALLKERFHCRSVQTNVLLRRPIRSVAVCGGAGAFLVGEAQRQGADAFVTGEMRYNDFFDHDQQLQIVALGHYQSEQYTTELFRECLASAAVPCHITTISTNPIFYY